MTVLVLKLYLIAATVLTFIGWCHFIAGARADEQQAERNRSAERAGFDGFHTHFDTRKGA